MILHFLFGEDDSIGGLDTEGYCELPLIVRMGCSFRSNLVAAAQVTAIRETGNDLLVYLANGTQVRVRNNDYNRSAVALWQAYVEGQK